MKEEILVDVSPDGAVNITTKGFKGSTCKAATKALEEALGTVVKDTPTPEMHMQQQVHTKAKA